MGRRMRSSEPKDLEDYSTTKLRKVNWPQDLDLVRRLLQDYRKWLADHVDTRGSSDSVVPVGLRRIDEEIAGLPGVYGPPHGEIILAFAPDGLAACGALRELEPRVGEIKRVYVRADHRGPGFGPRLTRALLESSERVRIPESAGRYAANHGRRDRVLSGDGVQTHIRLLASPCFRGSLLRVQDSPTKAGITNALKGAFFGLSNRRASIGLRTSLSRSGSVRKRIRQPLHPRHRSRSTGSTAISSASRRPSGRRSRELPSTLN